MTLVEAVDRYTHARGGVSPFETSIRGLTFLRSHAAQTPAHRIFTPSLCVTLQGAKLTTFGSRRFRYPAGKALVVSVEIPAVSSVVEASERDPYLGIILELDLGAMREVVEQIATLPPEGDGDAFAAIVTDITGPLEECLLRLARLLETPAAIPVVTPLIMREISFWLLSGPQGAQIARFVLGSSRPRQMVEAITALRHGFDKPIRVEHLADIAQMSPSTFHREFKTLTSMTPIQYQKQLRLLQARQLIRAGAANAETAAYKVGYASASQFSREYARMFGAPPRRDAAEP